MSTSNSANESGQISVHNLPQPHSPTILSENNNAYNATGANPSIPEMTEAAQLRHAKHLREGKSYYGLSMAEYVQKASELVRSAVGGDIVGFKESDGAIVRYNKATGDFVKGYSTGVATMFKPSSGIKYFEHERGK